jgi:hypothetical protein
MRGIEMPVNNSSALIKENNHSAREENIKAKPENDLQNDRLQALVNLKVQTAIQYNSFWHKQNKLTLCENAYKTNPSPELEKKISKLKTGIERKKQLFAETQPETVIRNLETTIDTANTSPRP